VTASTHQHNADTAPLVVAVTGAQGYVGGAVAEALATAGHEVVALTRRLHERYSHRPYSLAEPLAPDLLSGIDVVIHCAYDWAPNSWDDVLRVNVEGTRRLLDASVASGARFILVSSVSAYAGTRQMYGNAKLATEQLTLSVGGNAVRLGTVYGGANGGLVGLLLRLARLPLIPVFSVRSPQALIRVDNAAAALVALAEAREIRGQLVGLASDTTVEFGAFVRALSLARGKPSVILPVPWLPIYLLMRVVEKVGLPLPIHSETVLGLARPTPVLASLDLWDVLGVSIDPPDFGSFSLGQK
jgi:nucleoside-diphosphate-sugar epimerase